MNMCEHVYLKIKRAGEWVELWENEFGVEYMRFREGLWINMKNLREYNMTRESVLLEEARQKSMKEKVAV